MKSGNDTARKVAEFLLQIKAVQLKPTEPFTWASGWKSPIYCDNRKTLSYPSVRTYIRQSLVALIRESYGKPEAIVGVATGGIAMGALVAQDLGVPFAYTRSGAKDHGMKNKIEGVIESGQSVVVIEDLVSTGNSSLQAVDVLRHAGADVKGLCAIFTYGFDVAQKAFEKASCPFVALTDYSTLIDEAVRLEYISDKQLESLHEWRTNPQNWGQPTLK